MDAGAVTVGAGKAGGAKCARCWGFSDALGGDERHPELCPRCTPIVVKIDPGMVWTKKAEEVDVEEKVEA
jgi:isoleucyl-tRNA synthetase